jgi:bisphosphoglycerate-independent phosphoglycerate mutase (AlkP superfamily)
MTSAHSHPSTFEEALEALQDISQRYNRIRAVWQRYYTANKDVICCRNRTAYTNNKEDKCARQRELYLLLLSIFSPFFSLHTYFLHTKKAEPTV